MKHKAVLVICAMRSEYQALINKIRVGKEATFAGIQGTLFPIPGGEAFAFHCPGIGKVCTAFTIGKLAEAIDIQGIINTGVGGSLSDRVNPLDVVIANKVAYHDVDLTAFGNPYGQLDGFPLWFEVDKDYLKKAQEIDVQANFRIVIGSIISGDKFVTEKNLSKKELKLFNNPDVCDMESAAVAQCATMLKVPFCIIRSISDNTRQKSNSNLYEEFLELAAKHAASVTLWMLNIENN